MRHLIILFFSSILMLQLNAQETVGLLINDLSANQSEGYTLINPLSDNSVFLINNCGEVVNQWDFSHSQPSVNAYLLENGNLLQTNRFFCEIRDWNNNIIWSIDNLNVLGVTTHHDIEPLPNGNILALVRDRYTKEEIHALGKDTSFQENFFVLEKVIEIEPIGNNSANIVWEWKFIDHIVQDFDSSKPNFGVISNNPHLLDINYDNPIDPVNFIHLNGIDYNESLDQIIISSRHLREVFIIDHSTTTAEAATGSGGNSGKGGDFLWRWGNPEVYDMGTSADQQLGLQHDPQWVKNGAYQGKISVFSNFAYGTNPNASSIHIIDPYENGDYSLSSGKFLPINYDWSWDGIVKNEPMQTAIRGSVYIMENGNALVNESVRGRLSEVTPDGNVIWVYEIPINNTGVINQFEPEPIGNAVFKAVRYHTNYPAFNGVTFNNTGIIEDQNSISDICIDNLNITDNRFNDIIAYPNPVNDYVNIVSQLYINKISIFDIEGKLKNEYENTRLIDLSNYDSGTYIMYLEYDDFRKAIKLIKK